MHILCPSCEYDLTGLREHRCPECGEPFDPDRLRENAIVMAPLPRIHGIVSLLMVLAFVLLTPGMATTGRRPPMMEEVVMWLPFIAIPALGVGIAMAGIRRGPAFNRVISLIGLLLHGALIVMLGMIFASGNI